MIQPYDSTIRRYKAAPRGQSGYSSANLTDAYPLTSDADARAIRQAERSRNELLGADPEWWAMGAEYCTCGHRVDAHHERVDGTDASAGTHSPCDACACQDLEVAGWISAIST